MSETVRIGILGGTFDPPHEAHLAMARRAYEEFNLNTILFIPCHQNPLKDFTGHASPFHRYVMTQLATLVEENFLVSPLELNRGGPSFMIDTLKDLSKTGYELHLIMGMDAWNTISDWKDSHLYKDYCSLIVFTREGQVDTSKIENPLVSRTSFITGFDVQISSTEIRKKIRRGDSVAGDISTMVKLYIEKYELYFNFRDQNKLVDQPIEKYFVKEI